MTGRIGFTVPWRFGAAKTSDELGERDQVRGAERTAAGGHLDERHERSGVGPPHRQRQQLTAVVDEEHPVLAPGLAELNEQELSAAPGMERMGHRDDRRFSVGKGCN